MSFGFGGVTTTTIVGLIGDVSREYVAVATSCECSSMITGLYLYFSHQCHMSSGLWVKCLESLYLELYCKLFCRRSSRLGSLARVPKRYV